MSNGTTKYSDGGISPRVGIYAERRLLKYAAPVEVLDKFGLKREMPKNKGQTIKFRRPNTFTAATAPLSEGVTPTATQFSYTDVTANLTEYGQLGEITDHIEDTHEDQVLNDLTEQLGKNVGRTREALSFGVMKAGTTVFRANGAQRSDINMPVSLNKIRAVVKFLKNQKAEMISSALEPSPDWGTRAVEEAFVAVCHTDLEPDLRNLPGFQHVSNYGTRKRVHDREFGTVESIRFVTTPDHQPWADAGGAKAGSGMGTMVSTSGTNADVYPILIFGEEAYGHVPLRGQGSIEPSIVPVNKKDKADPLGQRGYAGWKMWYVCKILNDNWLARLEVATTDVNV